MVASSSTSPRKKFQYSCPSKGLESLVKEQCRFQGGSVVFYFMLVYSVPTQLQMACQCFLFHFSACVYTVHILNISVGKPNSSLFRLFVCISGVLLSFMICPVSDGSKELLQNC